MQSNVLRDAVQTLRNRLVNPPSLSRGEPHSEVFWLDGDHRPDPARSSCRRIAAKPCEPDIAVRLEQA